MFARVYVNGRYHGLYTLMQDPSTEDLHSLLQPTDEAASTPPQRAIRHYEATNVSARCARGGGRQAVRS